MRINSPSISHQTIEGEVVIINLENGCYYSLLSTAAAIWQFVEAGWSAEEIVELVAQRYPSVADAAVTTRAFLEQLVAEQIIVSGGDTLARTEPPGGFPDDFSAPLLEKFTDMQELLMLDPIHEVDAMGWPHKPADQ